MSFTKTQNKFSKGIDDKADSTAVTIDETGAVGVGASKPADIGGGADLAVLKPGGARFVMNGKNRNWFIRGDSGVDDLRIGLRGNADTTDGDRVVIGTTGVGIGTDDPLNLLHLTAEGAIYSTVRLDASANTTPANYGLRAHDGVFDIRNFIDNTTPFTIAGDGNVGINTTIMQSKLHIDDPTVTSNTDAPMISFSSGRASNRYSAIGQVRGSSSNQVGLSFYTTNNQDTPTEKMRITSSGNVGIGTSDAGDAGLVIDKKGGGGTNANIAFKSNVDTYLRIGRFGTGVDSGMAIGNNYSRPSGFLADDPAYPVHQIAFNTDGSLGFGTGPAGLDYPTERMRITSTGNLLVGTTSPMVTDARIATTNSASHALYVEIVTDAGNDSGIMLNCETSRGGGTGTPFIEFRHNITKVGSISNRATSVSYNTTSDERLKENIVDAPAGNIDAIRVRSYDWKSDGSHQTYGMIAQELVDVAPEAVTQGKTEDDMWAVDYSKLVPMLVKEIQELKAKVAELESR